MSGLTIMGSRLLLATKCIERKKRKERKENEKEWCDMEEVAFFGYPDDGLGDGYISDDVYCWH